MLPLLRLILPFLLFPLCAAAVFRFAPKPQQSRLFAVVNVFGAFGICLLSPMAGLFFWQLKYYLEIAIPVFAFYFLAVALHYWLLRKFAMRAGWLPSIGAIFPILWMFAIKYLPFLSDPFRTQLDLVGKTYIVEFFVGLSYMAFRLSHLTMEVRNEIVPFPTFSEYLSFAFFVPTLIVGPISRYSVFRRSLETLDRVRSPIGQSLLRMLIGFTKYLFLASLIEQLGYRGLLMDSYPHPWIDLPVASMAFCVYLYLNFSGYCDLAIGSAGVLGIEVEENFNRPFTSRNIQEFWTRWHITLSQYLRDMVFSPFSKELVRRMGMKSAPHASAIAIFTVFVAMGAWHGLAWNFLLYGTLHGIGVVACHYYTIFLKKRLGRAGYSAYEKNPLIRSVGVGVTFAFVCGTLFFFANSFSDARTIFDHLH